MAKRPTINTLTNTASPTYLTQLNQNFTNIRNQFDNTLSLDGSTPNAMNADFDLNGNDLINANSVNTATLKIGGQAVVPSTAVNQTVKKEFETVAELLASTLTYTFFAVDDYVRVSDGNFVYKVAASGASDQHVTTAGSVKLYAITRHVDALGAKGDGTTDDSARFAVAALVGGQWELRPSANYRVNNVALNVTGAVLHCEGVAYITKNANGPIFTGTGADLGFVGIQFSGSGSFTGHNLDITGDRPRFVRCNSVLAADRALKATGAHVYVEGGYWNTTDATSNGFDIELGLSGVATLYQRIIGINTTQATGGILMTDTGSASIVGSQFGKLTIQGSGSPPAGSNGGYVGGNRINGAVSIGLSNTVAVGNTVSNVAVTIQTGLTGVIWDNLHAVGSTLSNLSGDGNHIIRRESSRASSVYASAGQINVYGGDAASTALAVRPASNSFEFYGDTLAPNYRLPNLGGVTLRDTGGTNRSSLFIDSSNNITVGNAASSGYTVLAGNTSIYLNGNAGSQYQAYAGALRPVPDNTYSLGTSGQRWSVVYAGTGTINTSDERLKTDILPLDEAERRVAVALKGLIRKYKFRDAVAEKGSAARWHVGIIAQDVIAAFSAEGLDAFKYGILCYDTWDAEPAVEKEEVGTDGEVISAVMVPAREAGDRYAIRYEELMAFIVSVL